MNVLDRPLAALAGHAAERQLQDAVARACRQKAGRVAVVLHLSRLSPPAPRPHHRRIARVLLQDVAARHDGQVFALQSGDLVLLCRAAPEPLALPEIMARLLRVDAPDPASLVSLWHLDHDAALLQAYAATALARHATTPPEEEDTASQTGLLMEIGTVLSTAPIGALLQRQAAVLLERDGLLPLFREVTFSIAALETRSAAIGRLGADPFLFRHLATLLDQRMLDGFHDIGAGPSVLHLNFTVSGLLSPAFTRFTEACHRCDAAVGIEISLMEACADPAGFARARAVLAAAGMTLVLDGVSHLALLLTRPWALKPDLLKLDWSPRLPELQPAEAGAIDRALARIGPARVVLHRAETEAAMHWGLARGIRRFQGRHVDAMLGASRLVACPQAQSCTLRQCIARAAAADTAGQAGCRNLSLLNAGLNVGSMPLPAERAA